MGSGGGVKAENGAHGGKEEGKPEKRIVVWEHHEKDTEEEGGWRDDHVSAEWRIGWLANWVIIDLHTEETHVDCCSSSFVLKLPGCCDCDCDCGICENISLVK